MSPVGFRESKARADQTIVCVSLLMPRFFDSSAASPTLAVIQTLANPPSVADSVVRPFGGIVSHSHFLLTSSRHYAIVTVGTGYPVHFSMVFDILCALSIC